ncbi:hypothetical protein PCANC_15522 [Puccinia coronata f. sp. avenae]|uniref:Uncharacterized protein n=1 Tax=Puccinia coronata f. sp. avenae TaxID=200324 RepID=A0A2N5SIQ7_9BASI|nr:hypothetical protein PCANC_15522 [Puccinia coronata f. sp. avenae]
MKDLWQAPLILLSHTLQSVFSFQSGYDVVDLSQATRAPSVRKPKLIPIVTPADSESSTAVYRVNGASHFRILDWRSSEKVHPDSQVHAPAGLVEPWGIPNKRTTPGQFLGPIGQSTNHKRKEAPPAFQSNSHKDLKSRPDLSLTLGHSESAHERQMVHGNPLGSKPQLDLSLALGHPGNAGKRPKLTPAPTAGVDTDARSGWLRLGERHGNALGFESQLDLRLNSNHAGVVRERKHIASTDPGQSTQVYGTKLGNLLDPASRPDRRSAFHVWRSNTEKQSVTATSRDKHPANVNGPTFNENENENDAPRSSISGSSSRPSTVQSFDKPLPEVSTGRGVTTSTSEDESKQLPEVYEAPAEATSTRDHSAKTNEYPIVTINTPPEWDELATSKRRSSKKGANASALRPLFHSSDTERIWAWIYGGVTHAVDLAQVKMKDSIKKDLVLKLVSTMDEIPQQGHHLPNNANLHEKVSRFFDFLMLFNLQLLHELGSASTEDYTAEVHDLCTWLIDSIKNERNPPSNPSGQGNDEIFPGVTLKHTVNNVVNLLTSSQSSEVLYQLLTNTNKVKRTIASISESHLILTHTIVTLSASYYKLISTSKWTKSFKHEGRFMLHLSSTQFSYITSRRLQYGRPKTCTDALQLLPWKNDLFDGKSWDHRWALGNRVKYPIVPYWETWVKPFVSQNPSDVLGADVWGKIFLIQTEKAIVEDPTPLKLAREKFEPNLTNESLSQTFSQMYLDRKFSVNQVKKFVKLVWVLNSRLIEAFGYEFSDRLYKEKQIDLQNHLFSILNLQPGTHQEGFENFDQNTRTEERMISDLIFLSLMCKELTSTDVEFRGFLWPVLKYQEKMTEAAVKMMSLHYRKINHAKWLDVFVRESGFVAALVDISNRLQGPRYQKTGVCPGCVKLRAINLLPWKDDLIISGAQRQELKKIFKSKREEIDHA